MFGGFGRNVYFCSRIAKKDNKMKSLNLISNIIIIRLRKGGRK